MLVYDTKMWDADQPMALLLDDSYFILLQNSLLFLLMTITISFCSRW